MTSKNITPREGQPAYQSLDQRASSHPALRPRAPRDRAPVSARRLQPGQRLDWYSHNLFLPYLRLRHDHESAAPLKGT